MRRGRALAWIGSAVLVATAAFHASGYSAVVRATSEPTLSPSVAAVSRALWIFASTHWLFVAVVAAVAAHGASRVGRIVLCLAAGVLAVDVGLLLAYLGPFVGEALLAAAAIAYLGAALRLRGAASDTSPGWGRRED